MYCFKMYKETYAMDYLSDSVFEKIKGIVSLGPEYVGINCPTILY